MAHGTCAPTLLADTAALFRCTVARSRGGFDAADALNAHDSNYFREAQWTADGTSIITNSADHKLRTFVAPQDLLSPPHSKTLTPFSTHPSPEPINSFAPYPLFDLADPTTTLALAGANDHPIQLLNALLPSASARVATYPFVNSLTEAHQTPHCLAFTRSSTHFLAGTHSLIAAFDLSRSGEGPVEKWPTIPSRRKKIVGGGVGMKGIVSAMGISGDGVLAAGTFTRFLSLYAGEGRAGRVAVFPLPGAGASAVGGEEEDGSWSMKGGGSGIGGAGVTAVKWSPCSRYLYVAERKSDGVLVYDIRGGTSGSSSVDGGDSGGRLLGSLVGRRALTNQRLGIEVVANDVSHDVWAGGSDGRVRVWKSPFKHQGAVTPEEEWAANTDPVTSTIAHPAMGGAVVATCSGERKGGTTPKSLDDKSDIIEGDRDSSSDEARFDNTLKIWSLP